MLPVAEPVIEPSSPLLSRLYWLSMAAVGVFAIVTLIWSLPTIGGTMAGFRTTSDLRISDLLLPSWTGAGCDLPPLHHVRTVDGDPVSSGRALIERVAALPAGTPVTYGIDRADGTRETVTIPTQRFTLYDWLATCFLFWLLGLAYALVGGLVSWLKPGDTVARIHFVTCMNTAVLFLCVADATSTYHLVRGTAFHLLLVSVGCAAGVLATVFPRPWRRTSTWQTIWLGTSAALAAWLLWDQVNGGLMGVTIATEVFPSVGALALPAAVAWTVVSRSSTPQQRIQAKILLAGIGIPYLVPIVGALIHVWLRHPVPGADFVYLAMLAFPLTIGYAIVRYRLFDIDLVLRRTLTYGLVAASMLVIYACVTVVSRLVIGHWSMAEGILSTLVIGMALGPWRDRVNAWLVMRFFRHPYDLTQVMAAFHRVAGESLDATHLLETYAATLDGALAVRFVFARLHDGTEHRRGEPSTREDRPLWLPLAFDGTPMGAVQIGTKHTDVPFTEVDRHLIDELTQRLELWLHLVERVAQDRLQRETIAALTHADAMKSEFLNLVSHELRRPLSEILACVNLVSQQHRPELSDRLVQHFQRLHMSTAMLAGLVNDLLDAGQLQSGRFQLRPGPLTVSRVVEDALDTAQPLADLKGLHLVADLDPCPGSWGDHIRLVQVVSNLLSNAIRHTAPSGTVTVRVRVTDDHWHCEVADTGEGIPAAFLPRLFQQFGGSPSDRQSAEGGLGLGLYICKAIVTAHGGTIDALSKPGSGSTFRFAIPLAGTNS